MRPKTVSRCPAMAIAGLVAGSVLAFLVGGPAQPLFAQDYQVFGDVEGVTTYHYLGDAEAEHRLTGSAQIRADHRLTFDRAELVADTEVEIRSPGSLGAEDGFAAGYGEEELDYFIDEAYLTLFPLSPVTVSAGKQRVNWGTGYTFTSTDTLHPRAPTGRDEGFRGASVTWTPTADLTLAAHVSADGAFDDPEGAAQNGMRYAAYGSAFLGNAEVFVSGVYGPDSTLRPGAGVSVGVLGFVLAAEGACACRRRGGGAPESRGLSRRVRDGRAFRNR